MKSIVATTLGTLAAAAAAASEPTPSCNRIFEFPLKNAAVATFDATFPSHQQYGPALLLTSFSPFGRDGVYAVTNVKDVLANPTRAVNMTTLDGFATWPNMAAPVPVGAIPASNPSDSFVLTAGGFFVSPFKSTGSINVLEVSSSGSVTKTEISTPVKGNFYHQAEWTDIDGDGTLDIIAARAYKSMNPFAKATAELVWLKPPTARYGVWEEQSLTAKNGPGVAFCLTDVNNDGKMEVVAAQFFVAQQLSIWYCDAEHWSSCINGTNIKELIIDDSEQAPFFAVEYTDLNGDGVKEILATTNTANGKGAVYIYEASTTNSSSFSSSIRMEEITWKKTKIAEGYKPMGLPFPGKGAPGRANSFKIHVNDTKKAIVVSGDDGGVLDVLVLKDGDEEGSTWQYTKIRVLNSTGTVGSPGVMDIDGDGWAEFAIPLFAENKVAVYSFQ